MRQVVLAALALAQIAAVTAEAQQTPGQYCASLPMASCEILNVEMSMGLSNNGTTEWTVPLVMVKYCKASTLKVLFGSLDYYSPNAYNRTFPLSGPQNNDILTWLGGLSGTLVRYNLSNCVALP